jgi:hypothetical protein
MSKILYFIEFVIIFVLLIPLSLNFDGAKEAFKGFTIPNFSQAKSAVSVTRDDPNSADYVETRTTVCQDSRNHPMGFPFVYKSNDTCERGPSYQVGLFLNYVAVLLVAFGAAKLTSILVSRVTKN